MPLSNGQSLNSTENGVLTARLGELALIKEQNRVTRQAFVVAHTLWERLSQPDRAGEVQRILATLDSSKD